MIIKKCHGYELEKEKKNSPEDLFNRSEVNFVVNGKEQTLSVLYLRYFDEKQMELTPFTADPIVTVAEKGYTLKDVVALALLLNNEMFRQRSRVYVSDEKEFATYFKNIDVESVFDILRAIETDGTYEVSASFQLIK